MVSKVKPDSLREQIYKQVIREVISGNFAPGTIITESALIKETGFSKSPVRDALIELCKDGILENIPRMGYLVKKYTPREFDQIKEFRICIEVAYLEKNWNHVSDELIHNLREVLALETSDDEPYIADAIEHWIRNQRFHLALAKHWRDPFFTEMLETALNRQTIAYAQYYWQGWHAISFPLDVSEHNHFIEALEARNLTEAKAALLKDLSAFTPISD